MSVSDATPPGRDKALSRVGVARCAMTGAVVFSVLFLVCWLTGLFGVFGGMHMYMPMLALGTSAPILAVTLLFGLVCSAAAGLFVGALTGFTYNAFDFLARG